MRYRVFGPSGLRVSKLVLGTMTFGEDWGWGTPPDECRRLLTAYAEAGGNVIDTANRYTDGASERIVGDLLGGGDRDHFVVSTKYTVTTDPSDPNAAGNHRLSLVRSVEKSLQRLRTDRIDMLWAHIWDPLTPIDETMRALDDLVRAGKVLYIGVSDMPAWVVARAQALAEWRGWSPLVGIQVPYSLVNRDVDRELLPMADAHGLSVFAWSPLAGGVLSGKFTRPVPEPGNAESTRVAADDIAERDLGIAQVVDAVADDLGVSSSQVALAWTIARSPAIHPIVGARRLDQLTDNLGAVDVELPAEARARLDEASAVALGFPLDFIASTQGFVYGEAGERVDGRASAHATVSETVAPRSPPTPAPASPGTGYRARPGYGRRRSPPGP
jgi:aryl-alcohol dehydrogenase-like predicted oxidoreductase